MLVLHTLRLASCSNVRCSVQLPRLRPYRMSVLVNGNASGVWVREMEKERQLQVNIRDQHSAEQRGTGGRQDRADIGPDVLHNAHGLTRGAAKSVRARRCFVCAPRVRSRADGSHRALCISLCCTHVFFVGQRSCRPWHATHLLVCDAEILGRCKILVFGLKTGFGIWSENEFPCLEISNLVCG